MGKVNSIFKVKGKLGDYVFYTLNGKQVVRRAAAKKKGTKTEAQQRVVEQNTEFGKASAAGKALRTALAEECGCLNDRYLYQRVSQLMLRLKSCDPASSGWRTVAGGLGTAEGQKLMRHFNFHKKQRDFPELLQAVKQEGQFHLRLHTAGKAVARIVELQINFESGKFRRHVHEVSAVTPQGAIILKNEFRSKKGFTDLALIFGTGFLQGVLVNNDEEE